MLRFIYTRMSGCYALLFLDPSDGLGGFYHLSQSQSITQNRVRNTRPATPKIQIQSPTSKVEDITELDNLLIKACVCLLYHVWVDITGLCAGDKQKCNRKHRECSFDTY